MTVYLIRCTINGKCYVGKTAQKLYRRWSQHRAEVRLGRKDTPLYRDMRAMGTQAFELEVLAEACDQRRLAQLERRFIREMKASTEGYNQIEQSTGGRMKFKRTVAAGNHTAVHRARIRESVRQWWADRKAAA